MILINKPSDVTSTNGNLQRTFPLSRSVTATALRKENRAEEKDDHCGEDGGDERKGWEKGVETEATTLWAIA